MATSRKKTTSRKRGASRGSKGSSAGLWLLTGILIGLGLAWYLFAKGLIPQPQSEQNASSKPTQQNSATDTEEVAPASTEQKNSNYDFFTVLPEMEVVVPEQELNQHSREKPAVQSVDGSRYLLQVGSFREAGDAEQLKARLALLGIVANVQMVTVNDATWHRVRVGPVSSAREADVMRGQLANNGIDSLVLKDQ